MAKLPLDGIRVIDQTIVWAGPYITMMLADMGAEVIRPESPDFAPYATRGVVLRPPDAMLKNGHFFLAGYPDRKAGQRPWNRTAVFNYHARNKLSMTIKLTTPEGRDIFKRLAEVSDVVVDNNAYGVQDRLGLGYEVVKEVNPEIIYLSLPAYGNHGPWKQRLGIGRQVEHVAGHTLLRKYPDLEPTGTLTDIFYCDAAVGAMGAYAVLVALYHKHKTGKGQFIDMAHIETFIPQLGEAVMDYVMNGRIRESLGNRDEWAAPCNTYRCRGDDRWIAITVFNDTQWKGLCRVFGDPSWTGEERFSTQAARWHNQDELDPLIETWTIDKEDYEVMNLLQAEGVPAAPVTDEHQLYADVHLNERGLFEQITHVDCGTHRYPGIPWKMPRTPAHIRKPPCRLGEDNEYVYKRILKVSDSEYEQLENDGHISMDYDPSIVVRGRAKK